MPRNKTMEEKLAIVSKIDRLRNKGVPISAAIKKQKIGIASYYQWSKIADQAESLKESKDSWAEVPVYENMIQETPELKAFESIANVQVSLLSQTAAIKYTITCEVKDLKEVIKQLEG